MSWKQAFGKISSKYIDLEIFYKRLPNRATYTPQEVMKAMFGYDAKEVFDTLEHHKYLIWNGRLVVFPKHPCKFKKR